MRQGRSQTRRVARYGWPSALVVPVVAVGVLGCTTADRENFAKGYCAEGRCGRSSAAEKLNQDLCVLSGPMCTVSVAIKTIQSRQQKQPPKPTPMEPERVERSALDIQLSNSAPSTFVELPPRAYPRGCEGRTGVVLRYRHLEPRFQSMQIRLIQNGGATTSQGLPDSASVVSIGNRDLTVEPVEASTGLHHVLTCRYADAPNRSGQAASGQPAETWAFWKTTPPGLRACDVEGLITPPSQGDAPHVSMQLAQSFRPLLVDVALSACPRTLGEARRLASIRVQTQ